MMKDIKQVTIDGVLYEAERVTDSAGLGYIEVRDLANLSPLGRITYQGPELPMKVTFYGNTVDRSFVQWLLDTADFALA